MPKAELRAVSHAHERAEPWRVAWSAMRPACDEGGTYMYRQETVSSTHVYVAKLPTPLYEGPNEHGYPGWRHDDRLEDKQPANALRRDEHKRKLATYSVREPSKVF